MANADNVNVQYTVKELLSDQSIKLDRIERKVDEAFTSLTVAISALETRVTVLEQQPKLEERLRNLETIVTTNNSEDAGEAKAKKFLWPAVTSVITTGITWVIYFVTGHKTP